MVKRRERREGSDEDVPVGAFSDIAFLIIIYFVLTTTFTQVQGFETTFPSGSEGQAEDKTKTVQINDGKIFYQGKPLGDLDKLRQRLLDEKLTEKTNEKDRLVMLEVTGQITWEEYTQFMAVIHKTGGVVTVVREKKGGG